MNIILNTESVSFPLTGIGRYTYELARALERQAEIDSLRFFAAGRFVPQLSYAEQPHAPAAPRKLSGLKGLVQKSTLAMELYRHVAERLRANGLEGQTGCIYHGPNFFLPRYQGPCVATFHDLSPFTWSHCIEPAKVRYMQKELRKTLDRADRLITVSDAIRYELAEYFSYPLERIDTVPLACSPDFRPRPQSVVQDVLNRHGLAYQGYTLFVGTIEPRKNIQSLLKAYRQLPIATRLRWPLVLTGFKGWLSADIHHSIQAAEREGWARYLGYLPAQELPLLYGGARLFSFPSHYEGFGLPVLEAMSSGVPVVCSNSSSLPEVSGGAALLHAPDDIDTLSQHLAQGLEDSAWRQTAISQGMAHTAGFSWQRCAAETVAVYQKLAAGV